MSPAVSQMEHAFLYPVGFRLHPNGAIISILGFFMKAAVVSSLNCKWEVKEVPTPKAARRPHRRFCAPSRQHRLPRSRPGLVARYTDVHITHGMIPTQFPRVLAQSAGMDFNHPLVRTTLGASLRRAEPARQKCTLPEHCEHGHSDLGQSCRIHAGRFRAVITMN